MKFKYKKLSFNSTSEFFGKSVLKPIIPIELISDTKRIKYGALIDSGADFCIFEAEVGEYLGFDVKSGLKEPFGGIQDRAGSFCYMHEVKISVGGWEYNTTVGFSYDIAKHGFGILGQKGFFNLFSIKFDYKKEEIELKEVKIN
jgi:hypothetical protein